MPPSWQPSSDEYPVRVKEERQEQLKAVAELASVVAGFLMISFLQFNFDSSKVSQPLQLVYAASAALTARACSCQCMHCMPPKGSMVQGSLVEVQG